MYGLKIVNTQSPQVRKAYRDKNFKSRGVIKLLSEVWNIKKPSPGKLKEVFVGFEDILKGLKGREKETTELRILEYLIDNTDLDFKTWQRTEPLIIEEGILTREGIMEDVREIIKEKGRWEGRKEGLKKGRQEGRQQVILNMLKEKADISFISKVTGLSEGEIKKLKNDS